MSRDEVSKYFEVRFFSLVLVAISIIAVLIFLLLIFVLQGQYVYAVVIGAIAVVLIFSALEIYTYAKSLKRRQKGNR